MRALHLAVALILLISGLADLGRRSHVSAADYTDDELPSASLTCSVILIGNATPDTPSDAWSLVEASIRCQCEDSSLLYELDDDTNSCGIHYGSRLHGDQIQYAASNVEGAAAFSGFVPLHSGDVPDVSLRFNRMTHLRLTDTVIRGIPLKGYSTEWPSILTCKDCTYVSTSNVTIEDVYRPPGTPRETATFGAMDFRNVSSAHLDGLRCSNIHGATGWACLHLQLVLFFETTSTVWLGNSVFEDTSTASDTLDHRDFYVYGEDDVSVTSSRQLGSGFGSVLITSSPYVAGNAKVDIVGCTFKYNTGGYGAGLTTTGSLTFDYSFNDFVRRPIKVNFNVNNSTFLGNRATMSGGAMFHGDPAAAVQRAVSDEPAEYEQHFRLLASTVSDNEATSLGGAFCFTSHMTSLVVDAGSFVGDNQADTGGAFHFQGGIDNVVVQGRSRLSGNTARVDFGGALCSNGLTARVSVDEQSDISGNTARLAGGALWLEVADVIVVAGASRLNHNSAESLDSVDPWAAMQIVGGAMHIKNSVGSITISDGSCICFNRADGSGGAIHVGDSILTSLSIQHNSDVSNNTVGLNGISGGGITVDRRLNSLSVINNSRFSGNSITENSLIMQMVNTMQLGGALHVGESLGSLFVSGSSQVSWNTAGNGGAAVYVGPSNPEVGAQIPCSVGQVAVTEDSCICNNTGGSGSRYGAVALSCHVARLEVSHGSCLCSNRMQEGSTLGGALCVLNGVGVFTLLNKSSISYNTGGDGGAVYVRINGADIPDVPRVTKAIDSFMCDDSSMEGNHARINGGVFNIQGSVSSFQVTGGSRISNNHATVGSGAILMEQGVFGRLLISDSFAYNNSADFAHGGFLYARAPIVTNDFKLAFDIASSKYPEGPYYIDIVRSNISSNRALKNGGAICIYLDTGLVSVPDSNQRQSLNERLLVNLRIYDSVFDNNQARQGGGGALAVLGSLPISTSKGEQVFDVSMGSHVTVVNSIFSNNTAGEFTSRLLIVQDVSPLSGQGGAMLLWTRPLPFDTCPSAGPCTLPTSDSNEISSESHVTTICPPDSGASSSSGSNSKDSSATTGDVTQHPCLEAAWPSGSRACRLQMDGAILNNNIATSGFGGGILAVSCAMRIQRSHLANNRGVKGAGLAYMDNDLPSAALAANPNQFAGGVVSSSLVNMSSPSRTAPDRPSWDTPTPSWPWVAVTDDTHFTQNTATTGGGGMYLEVQKTSVVVDTCWLTSNKATSEGGGLLVVASSDKTSGVPVFVANTTIRQCQVSGQGGGVAFFLETKDTAAGVAGLKVIDNSGSNGGGLFVTGVSGAGFNVSECDFEGNTAFNNGGGLSVDYLTTDQQPATAADSTIIHITGSNFNGNKAGFSGGGAAILLYLQVSVSLDNCTFTLNSASSGGGLFFDSHGGESLDASNCSFTDNHALVQGGGVHAAPRCGGRLRLHRNSTLASNQAGLYGGAASVALEVEGVSTIQTSVDLGGDDISGDVLASNATCTSASLALEGVLVSGNTAQQGGGIFTSPGAAVSVQKSVLQLNRATLVGGSMAAVNCSSMHVYDSQVVSNSAALSGGGIYSQGCRVLLLERSAVIQNSASAGGGIHLAGAITQDTTGNATAQAARRMLVADNGMSGASPVAILSRASFSGNSAAGFYTDPSQTELTMPLVKSYHAYGGHGGMLFVSGSIGVAVSRCNTTQGNEADVGTVVSTTQVCSGLSAAVQGLDNLSSSYQGMLQPVMNTLGADGPNWLNAMASLTAATSLECSLLVISDTQLSHNPVSPTPTPELQADGLSYATAKSEAQLMRPLLWMQDLRASALRAGCARLPLSLDVPSLNTTSGTRDTKSESEDIKALITQSEPSILPVTSPYSSGSCFDSPDSQEGSSALAVPATHMVVVNITGATLIPKESKESGEKQSAAGFAEWRAMVVYPGSIFDIHVQLLDGLGQRVLVDLPPFLVNLTLRPASTWPGGEAAASSVAILRSTGSTAASVVNTKDGLAVWKGIEIVGWPGEYTMEFTAQVDPDSPSPSYPVRSLELAVSLLHCEMGSELIDNQRLQNWTSCRRCSRDQVGLWNDTRTPLEQLNSSSYSTDMLMETDGLTWSPAGKCTSCCLTCPPNAACPGGALLLPVSGYWHSSPTSPVMHRCPQPLACGKNTRGSVDRIWSRMVNRFKDTNVTYMVVNTNEQEGSPLVTANSSTMTVLSVDTLEVILQKDKRALALAKCQQWWYDRFPPQKWAVLGSDFTISSHVDGDSPCHLYANEWGDRTSYMGMQCATGYAGHLCATCDQGYSLSVDFECSRCPPLAQTISLGLLAFWGTIGLVLFTTFSNMSEGRADSMKAEELSTLDILKTMITHLQYFIIITKLGIDYPDVIIQYQSVLSAITGTENYIAYSPSCLFENLTSAGQVAVQVLFGLVGPCMITFVTLLLWALRYIIAHKWLFKRAKGARIRGSGLQNATYVPDDDSENDEGTFEALSPLTSDQPDGFMPGPDATSSVGSKPSREPLVATAAELREGGAAMSQQQQVTGAKQAATVSAQASITPISPVPALGDKHHSLTTVPSAATIPTAPGPLHSAAPDRRRSSTGGGQAGPSTPKKPTPPRSTVTPGEKESPTLQTAKSTTFNDDHMPQFQILLASESNTWVPDAPLPRPDSKPFSPVVAVASLKLPATTTDSAVGGPISPAGPANKQSSVVLPKSAFEQYMMQQAAAGSRRNMHRLSSSRNYSMGALVDDDPVDPDAGPPLDVEAAHESSLPLTDMIKQWFATLNPRQIMRHADQVIPLYNQLIIVMMVASFILYPGLCQVALGIFACYDIDSGQGQFAANQKATWSRGYWVRDMEEECYSGRHKALYVPVGIAAVILFCLSPPAVYFYLTWKSRKNFKDSVVRLKYGFLYQQYKPKYYWWASVRQLQILALVAVEVFGRALTVLQQALTLLAVLIVTSAINNACSPERFYLLRILEFLSTCVLTLTITLGLYFVEIGYDDHIPPAVANFIGALILVINAAFILCFLALMVWRHMETAKRMRTLLSSSWNSLVHTVSRALAKIDIKNSLGSAKASTPQRSRQIPSTPPTQSKQLQQPRLSQQRSQQP